jgi:hypothetical protein
MNKVTVIVNSYNESETLFRRSLNSIQNNKNIDLQIILSTVKNDLCVEWAKDYNIDVVINEQPGIFQQINNTIKHIKGDYVTYSSSNDVMCDYKFKLESDILKRTNKMVCYSAYNKFNINGEKKVQAFPHYDFNTHLKGNYVSDCAMVKSETFFKYTPFIINFGNHAYYDFWLRIFSGEGNVFVYNPIPTWEYLITENSSHFKRSKNELKKQQNENLRKIMLDTHTSNI